jgi:pimeloyl-ACP methyl ester carboxylesterase
MSDSIRRFLEGSIQDRLAMVRDDAAASELRGFLGDDGYEEYRLLARRSDGEHLGIADPPNLIVVPGVMGSLLSSRTHGGVWWIDVRGLARIDQLGLSADGREDADPANRIEPFSIDSSYDGLTSALLTEPGLSHVLFAYDWRKSLTFSADALRDRIEAVHADNGRKPVHLIAHSMGGLMVRATLAKHGAELSRKLGRIVFIGTPHHGSAAIAGYLKNHLWGWELLALLGRYLSRPTLRSLWGVVGLLPAPVGIYPGTRAEDSDRWVDDDGRYPHPCANFDLYRADEWKLGLSEDETSRFQAVLDGAAAFHAELHLHHRQSALEFADRMLNIVGVGYKTLFRLEFGTALFGAWETTRKVTDRIPGDSHRDGDGRVPVSSARLDQVETRYVRGVHGGLQNIPAVYREAFRWLRGEPLELPTSAKPALSSHLGGEDQSGIPHLDGSARADPFGDDPGLWNMEPPDEARLTELARAVEAEALPAFNRVRLL